MLLRLSVFTAVQLGPILLVIIPIAVSSPWFVLSTNSLTLLNNWPGKRMDPVLVRNITQVMESTCAFFVIFLASQSVKEVEYRPISGVFGLWDTKGGHQIFAEFECHGVNDHLMMHFRLCCEHGRSCHQRPKPKEQGWRVESLYLAIVLIS